VSKTTAPKCDSSTLCAIAWFPQRPSDLTATSCGNGRVVTVDGRSTCNTDRLAWNALEAAVTAHIGPVTLVFRPAVCPRLRRGYRCNAVVELKRTSGESRTSPTHPQERLLPGIFATTRNRYAVNSIHCPASRNPSSTETSAQTRVLARFGDCRYSALRRTRDARRSVLISPDIRRFFVRICRSTGSEGGCSIGCSTPDCGLFGVYFRQQHTKQGTVRRLKQLLRPVTSRLSACFARTRYSARVESRHSIPAAKLTRTVLFALRIRGKDTRWWRPRRTVTPFRTPSPPASSGSVSEQKFMTEIYNMLVDLASRAFASTTGSNTWSKVSDACEEPLRRGVPRAVGFIFINDDLSIGINWMNI